MWKIVALALLAGCSSISLRPVNPDHHARKMELTQRLGVGEELLNATLAADQAECDKLDNEVTGFTAATVVIGVLGGGSGLTSVFTDSTPRYATAGTSVGLAAFSALFAYLSTSFAQKYARRCAVNAGGR